MRICCLVLALLGLPLGGCASGPAPKGAVRSMQELPPRYRAIWEAFRSADPGWPEMRAEVQADPELCGFVVDNLVREMLLAYGQADLSQDANGATRHFRRTRAELRHYPVQSSEVLGELLGIGNGSAAYLAGEVLIDIGRPALPAVLERLESPREQARQWSARLLAKLPNALDSEEQVLSALMRHLDGDKDWLTRAQCASALGERGAQARSTLVVRTALIRGLADSDPGVRRSAATALGHLADPDGIPALIDYLERGMEEGALRECMAAEAALSSLTGAEKGLGVAGWRAWRRSQRP